MFLQIVFLAFYLSNQFYDIKLLTWLSDRNCLMNNKILLFIDTSFKIDIYNLVDEIVLLDVCGSLLKGE